MNECYKCGITEDKAVLYDTILPSGVMKVCRKCSFKEDYPVMKSVASNVNLEKQNTSVYETLKKVSGVNPDIKPKSFVSDRLKGNESLKNIINTSAQRNFRHSPDLKKSLLDNFHWIILRARRLKHLTQEEFAREIQEPEFIVKSLEEGKISDQKVIGKVEKYLGVTLRKEEKKSDTDEANKDFDVKGMKEFTIADLHELKKKIEENN
ncbi:hypothetical protein J4407_01340 [Candidatus Pacearchaeota archaeon]|nr:hypothetical protein [Candidatus Pacearchaeota archaeon]